MRASLSEAQWQQVTEGQITAPDGTRYQRRSTKTKRRTCDEHIAAGSPLVLYYWAGGQLDWCDGSDAQSAWAGARGSVTQDPRLKGDLEWTAGLWERDDGQQLGV